MLVFGGVDHVECSEMFRIFNVFVRFAQRYHRRGPVLISGCKKNWFYLQLENSLHFAIPFRFCRHLLSDFIGKVRIARYFSALQELQFVFKSYGNVKSRPPRKPKAIIFLISWNDFNEFAHLWAGTSGIPSISFESCWMLRMALRC